MREKVIVWNFLDHFCFATQHLVGDKNQFEAKITKPLPTESTKPQPCAEENQFVAAMLAAIPWACSRLFHGHAGGRFLSTDTLSNHATQPCAGFNGYGLS